MLLPICFKMHHLLKENPMSKHLLEEREIEEDFKKKLKKLKQSVLMMTELVRLKRVA